MALIRQYDDTNFVTTLRAIAATMVVAVHTAAFESLGAIGASITHAGKYGVEIFFVISGFSIAVTFGQAANYRAFLVRRLFRIVPLYLLALTAVFVLTRRGDLSPGGWLSHFGTQLDAYNYFMHVTFLSCLDQTIGNSVIGVEWSIPVEIFWYAALPAILLWATTDRRILTAFVIAIAAVAATKGLAQLLVTPRPDLFAKWFPATYGPFFLLGVLAFRLRSARTGWLRENAEMVVRLSVLIFMAGLAVNLPGRRVVISLAVCLLIGLFDRKQHPVLTRLLEFRPLLFLGTISYSLYLTHLPVRNVMSDVLGDSGSLRIFAVTMLASIAVSSMLYLIVEHPTNELGKRVVRSRWFTHDGTGPSGEEAPDVIPIPAQNSIDRSNRRAA